MSVHSKTHHGQLELPRLVAQIELKLASYLCQLALLESLTTGKSDGGLGVQKQHLGGTVCLFNSQTSVWPSTWTNALFGMSYFKSSLANNIVCAIGSS